MRVRALAARGATARSAGRRGRSPSRCACPTSSRAPSSPAGSAGRRAPIVSAGPSRKPPASRSSIAPKTDGPSIRGRHIHSMLPLGATSARGLAVRQERVVRDRRERAPAERDVSDDLLHRVQQRVRRAQRRAGRWGRAAAPGGCPRRGCPASPRDAPRIVHACSAPLRVAAHGAAGRPSPRSSDSDPPRGASRSSARRARARRSASARACTCTSWRRACELARRASSPRFISRVGFQPSRVASQPSSSSAGDRRVGVVADVDRR